MDWLTNSLIGKTLLYVLCLNREERRRRKTNSYSSPRVVSLLSLLKSTRIDVEETCIDAERCTVVYTNPILIFPYSIIRPIRVQPARFLNHCLCLTCIAVRHRTPTSIRTDGRFPTWIVRAAITFHTHLNGHRSFRRTFKTISAIISTNPTRSMTMDTAIPTECLDLKFSSSI